MKTYTVTTKQPRQRDAERYLARYVRETGDNSARVVVSEQ